MSVLRAVPISFILTMLVAAQQTISFPTKDGGRLLCGDLYGQGDRAVILAHGSRFNKESWKEQAQVLATKRISESLPLTFVALAVRQGGRGQISSVPPFQTMCLQPSAAGNRTALKPYRSLVGSFGGAAAGDASIMGQPG